MAGPAIRYWEFANALSKKHEVTLVIPNDPEVLSDRFKIIKFPGNFRTLFKNAHAIITMKITHSMALAAKMHGVKIILDAYDPLPLEWLEINKHKDLDTRKKELDLITNAFKLSFSMADAVLCANENQRDLWTGLQLGLKGIDPVLYDQDPSWKKQIGIVPFGLPSDPPVKSGTGPKSLFNLKETDKIILWGGGIWNWFDPLTLIKAIHAISQGRSDIHLVFMGVGLPNEDAAMASMPARATQLAKELKVLDKHVFFNHGWIPYEDRASFLLEADIGVSTHFESLETRYAFRTRILDYIWAGLPVICTEGDSFSRLVEQRNLGLTVPYGNVEALAKAIIRLIDHPNEADQMKSNLKTLSREFHWNKVVEPLQEMISEPKKKQSKLKSLQQVAQSAYRLRGPLFPLKFITARLSRLMGMSRIP